MSCEYCKHCRYPRSSDDNNGLCKCKLMKYKTIDVYVGGGETPDWCPMTDRKKLIALLHKAEEICDSTLDCDSCKYVLSGSCKTALIADHLLANDVIVPIRCKDCEYYTPINHQSTKWKSKTFF